jgi:hypothetical protein
LLPKAFANINSSGTITSSGGATLTVSLSGQQFVVSASFINTSSVVLVTVQGPGSGGYSPRVDLAPGHCNVNTFSLTTAQVEPFSIVIF